MLNFHLRIQTPHEDFAHENLSGVTLPGMEGPIGVRPQHAPMILQLKAGLIHVFKESSDPEHYFINPGIAHVSQDFCLILTEKSQRLSALDPVILKEQLEKYHDDLAGMDLEYEQRMIERQITIIRSMLHALKNHQTKS